MVSTDYTQPCRFFFLDYTKAGNHTNGKCGNGHVSVYADVNLVNNFEDSKIESEV